MDITFNCDKCGQSLTIDEAGAGQLVDCPKCGTPLEVPYKSKHSDKATQPIKPEHGDSRTIRRVKRTGRVLGALVALAILWFAIRGAWRIVGPDHNPIGKTEQQVARLYGQPIKLETYKDLITRTYLTGDIVVDVTFYHNRSNDVRFRKDSSSLFDFRRITMPEAQRLLKDISGGRKWQVGETKSGFTHYMCVKTQTWHFDSHFPWLISIARQWWSASYAEQGFLFVDGLGFEDKDYTKDVTNPSSSNAIGIGAPEAVPVDEEVKPTALDLKGGFREYRLGMHKADVYGDLTKEHSFSDSEDIEQYSIDSFDQSLGAFQINKIILEFDKSLGLLKEVRVWVKGKQNVEGVLEAFKLTYGDSENGGVGNEAHTWNGNDIRLRYSISTLFDTTATATWTSKKVNSLIEDNRSQRAKEGAADAAKGL